MMAEQHDLAVEYREIKNNNRLRAQETIPAILYGHDTDPTKIQVDEKEFRRVLVGGGRRNVLQLKLPDSDETRPVMIKEIQQDPVDRNLLHADFYQVAMDETLTIEVPLEVTGEEEISAGEGVLQFHMRRVEVECLPAAIPDFIEIDVSGLEIGDNLTLGEVALPSGVSLTDDPSEIVLSVVVPRMDILEEPEPEEEEELLEEPELIGEEEEETLEEPEEG